MFEVPPGTFTVVEPAAIAREAADALESLTFKGHSYRYVVSDETGTDEIASAIGREIGMPDLKWIKFGREDVKETLIGYGFSDGAADEHVEMFTALDSGSLFEDYVKHKPMLQGDAIEAFARKFGAAYLEHM